MMKKYFTFLLFSQIIFANALESTLDDEREWLEEETFVVSVSKVKEDAKKSAATVSVIFAKQIEAMGANTLLDVLRTVPGLGIQQSRTFVKKIEVRGIQSWFSEKVLIMLNGHSLNGLRHGGATLQYDTINLQNVKRIEIVRSPSSAMYGENAFTALINIITKSAEDIDGMQASVMSGSFDTQTYNILYGGKINDVSISGNLNFTTSDGYKASVAKDATGSSKHTNPTTEKISAYLDLKSKGFYFMGQYTDREEGARFGMAHAIDHRTNFRFKKYFLELGYKKEIFENLDFSSRVYYDHMDRNDDIGIFPKGFPLSKYPDGFLKFSQIEEARKGVEFLSTYGQENIRLTVGTMYENQALNNPRSQQNYKPTTLEPYKGVVELPAKLRPISEIERDLYAFYAELVYDPTDDIRITVGARYDHFSEFGGVFNPKLGLTWQYNSSNNFKFMYGEAFRALTFSELYSKNDPIFEGNVNLYPEEIHTTEFSWQNSSIDNVDITLTLFKSEIKNIVTINNLGQYGNRGLLHTDGLEVEVKYNLGRGSYLTGNYTHQDPENETLNTDVEDVPQHKAYIALNYRLGKDYNLYVDANYRSEQSRRVEDIRVPVEGFILANATLLVKKIFVDDMKLRLSIYNIFDENAHDSASYAPFDYPLPEKSVMSELTYTF